MGGEVELVGTLVRSDSHKYLKSYVGVDHRRSRVKVRTTVYENTSIVCVVSL